MRLFALIVAGVLLLAIAHFAAFRYRNRARALGRRYQELIAECLDRQPHHEREHHEAHGGNFTSALRVENVARRFERKIHQAGLPPLPPGERAARAKEALWPRR